ncbi:Receptor-like serine/threonine-protein kinase [Heracleum sosnowskyi]|uniref:Receptor-like serine/threonine-protein kinase n=1 Tax=Heracleum sosnowskyi TaxID=360622 RepID=A0AAD8IV12_9APIA|nr:Receptor-like serine/threonine-protein kinase [Heracleum sosnowskyi]
MMELVIFSTILLLSFFTNSAAEDLLSINQTIRDGESNIVSANNEFELGFFSPGSSTNRYVGIWFKKISYRTIVWVANRDAPLNNTSGILRIDNKAISLFDNDTTNTIIWSSNASRFVSNPVAQLLDTGNLVFRDKKDDGSQNFVWQSFDYMGDTMLPGMKLGKNLVTGQEWCLSSWKSVDDPSPGSFVHRMDTHGYPQLTLWKGSKLHARSGPWVGNRFSGSPIPKSNMIYMNEFVLEQKEIYYAARLFNTSTKTRFMLTMNGHLQRLIWNSQNQEWTTYLTLLAGDCDLYGVCGPYGTCDITSSPRCSCLRGFNPKIPEKWEAADWTNGCVRITPLNCGNGDGFFKFSGVKLPDTRHSWYNLSMNLQECRSMCLKNCTCTAYSNINVEKDGKGCLLWFEELMDIKGYTEDGQDIYVRMSASELDGKKGSRMKRTLFISIFAVLAAISALIGLYLFKKKKLNKGGTLLNGEGRSNSNEEQDLELPFFEFKRIVNATGNFCHSNKVGEGGFGPVYKGVLEDGQQIAVKRLSENSRQGVDEFKNEVSLIAKLQHRNLVSLLGYCIEEEERILIYEYMPNKSLDSYLFDKDTSMLADWPRRYNIINGLARGLLYLHQDSKLRIIHRDLKGSNVLLDDEMNPKISDFGMARSFGGSQTEANTTTVVGTYGYMPPEYVIDGVFSTKSDVYSFGVLVLEMVSRKRNRCFEHPDHNLNLLGHAWRCFNGEQLEELIDEAILESSSQCEVFRVIQIGLLCVQEYPEDRPDMSSVVLMLNSKIELPEPQKPGFFTERKRHRKDCSNSTNMLSSSSDYSITTVGPR